VEAKAYVLEEVPGEWVDYPFSGADSTFALMGNARYEYYLAPELEVHALAGVGYASRHLELTSDTHPNLDTDEGGFAWQAGLGASYEVSKGVKLGVDYIYFQGPSITRTVNLWDTPVTFNADGQNQSLAATLTFEFD
jgi:opacity protein-like surface antigen